MARCIFLLLALFTAPMLYAQSEDFALHSATANFYQESTEGMDSKAAETPGFYGSLEEFKNDRPRQDWKGHELVSRFHDYDWNEGLVELKMLKLKKAEVKDIGRVWGFSDGESVYVHSNLRMGKDPKLPKLRRRSKFAKLEEIGDFGYFESVYYVVILTPYAPTPLIPQREQKVIDFKTGRQFVLSKKKLRKLIADDPELSAEFEMEKHKNKNSNCIWKNTLHPKRVSDVNSGGHS